jgi:hypothetical protein
MKLFTCGKYDRLLVLSAYRLTARSSSNVMCCEPVRLSSSIPPLVYTKSRQSLVVNLIYSGQLNQLPPPRPCEEWDDDEQLDVLTLNIPGPSSETDKRAQDSSSECSGMIPSETAELPTFGTPVVSKVGVECDSSWATGKLKTELEN